MGRLGKQLLMEKSVANVLKSYSQKKRNKKEKSLSENNDTWSWRCSDGPMQQFILDIDKNYYWLNC